METLEVSLCPHDSFGFKGLVHAVHAMAHRTSTVTLVQAHKHERGEQGEGDLCFPRLLGSSTSLRCEWA